jgi:MOSC domain-containing protein YiiM
MQLPYGMFGENLSTEGLAEDTVNVGDRFRVGEAELMVTEPRMPCYKLGIKFGRADILKKFLASRRTGFYFAVLKEGRVKTGDSMELLSKDTNKIAVAEITRLYAFEKNDVEMLQRVVKLEALSASWRDYFQHHLEKLTH